MSGDMTLQQKKMLEPFGRAFGDMWQRIRSLPDDELDKMLVAMNSVSTTNCWCCTYAAAQALRPEVLAVMNERKRLRARLPSTPVQER
jgi:hypothetical protein